MYSKIISSKTLGVKDKIKNMIAYFLRRRGARKVWNDQWAIIYKHSPAYNKPADKHMEKEHRLYWKEFRRKVSPGSLRIAFNISGTTSPMIVPDELFTSDIEAILNNTSSVKYIANKSLYNHWFRKGIFPEDYLHNIDGEWMDRDLQPISLDLVRDIARGLTYPVVLKPNRDSSGGKGVFFPTGSDELIELLEESTNILVQEKLIQHSFFDRYNPKGINSVRVNVYRSVKDNQLHVLNMALRMGVGGSLDNTSSGGIVVLVGKEGKMHGFAIDDYGQKHFKHPDTGCTFDQQIPDYGKLEELALQIAGKVLYARVISLDLCYDAGGGLEND